MSLPSAFTELAAILLAAAAIGAIGARLRQPLIVSFIGVGVLVGPAGIGIVTKHEQIELLASVGIALLLFVVGLKLDIHMIRTVGPVALATGLGQVVFTSVAGYAIAIALGLSPLPALYVAVALTFSSTIIIVKLLSDKREIDALHGRIAVGFLIVQDIVVILVMIALTALAAGDPEGAGALPGAVALVALKGLAFLAAVVALMRWVLPPVTGQLARSPEVLVIAAIAWAVCLAAAGDLLGFSKEVGAFLAGISLASTPYRETIAGRLVTVRDFLLLFFFIDLGARLDLSLLGITLVPALVLSAFVLVGNPLIVMIIMGAMGYRKRTGFLAGLTVAQISEFSLILGAIGLGLGHIDQEAMGLITFVGLVTIGLSTYLILYSGPLFELLSPFLGIFERRMPYREEAADTPGRLPGADVILFGLGRYGGGMAHHLRRRGQRVVGVDFDPETLARWRAAGLPVLYGDAEDPELFEHLPLARARWVVSTAPGIETSRTLLRHLQDHRFAGKVAVACRTSDEAAAGLQGADVVLRPFEDAAEQAVDAITGAMARFEGVAASTPGLREVRLQPGGKWTGHVIAEVRLRETFGVSVLAVSRAGRVFLNPEPGFQLFPGDRMILSGEPDALARAADHLSVLDVPGSEEDADFAVEELPLAAARAWHGRSLSALDLRNRFGVTVIGIRHPGGQVGAPRAQDLLAPEDHLIAAGTRGELDRFREALAAAAPGRDVADPAPGRREER